MWKQLHLNKRAVGFWRKLLQRYQFSYEEEAKIKDGEEIVSQRFVVKGEN